MTDHHLTIFDVQHGACALLRSRSNGVLWTTMIDCGHKSNERGKWFPGDYLRSQGISVLDSLIITNLDEDHVSGLPNLLTCGIDIRHVFSNPTVQPWNIRLLKAQHGMGNGIAAIVDLLLARGVQISLPYIPDCTVACFWNSYPTAFEDENNLSIVTCLNFGGGRVMFTGDMECSGFNHLLRNHAGIREEVPKVEYFIAPHHGRESGICPDLFDVYGMSPKLTIISDDYVQYDSQETSNWYRSRTRGHRFGGKDRWVLTTRSDGNIDLQPYLGTMLVF